MLTPAMDLMITPEEERGLITGHYWTGKAALLPVLGPDPHALSLYFSPVFVTPDVLLGRKQKHVVEPGATLGALQAVDDDIFYLSYAG